MTRKYPKDLNVPRAIVLQKRAERKASKMAARRKCPKPQRKADTRNRFDPKVQEFVINLPHQRKNSYEIKASDYLLRVMRQKNQDRVTVKINYTTNVYLDWYWYQVSSGKLPIYNNVYPNVKEITESVSALHHTEAHWPDLKDTVVFVIADGSTPRTGLLFCNYAKHVISIDPMMKTEWAEKTNLTCIQSTIEDYLNVESKVPIATKYAIIAVHPHVPLENYLFTLVARIPSEADVFILTIPCCIPQELSVEQCETLHIKPLAPIYDWGIHSPCRVVKTYSQIGQRCSDTRKLIQIMH